MKTFEAQNPGSTLVIEEQQWTGLVDKLTTSLSSNDTPDIVEMGNTQSPAFTSSGALLDISDIKDAIGGDDLLPGFVEAGSWDGKLYAAPYYSGARIVFYNTAQYATAGVQVPTTLDEYVANGEKLAQALPGVSGSTSRARTGTTRCPSSGRTAARSPCRRTASGRRRCPAMPR